MTKQQRRIRWLYDELPTLLDQGVLNSSTAESLKKHYGSIETTPPRQRLIQAVATLGSLLIGFGIILLFAYNWDELSKSLKTILAFAPLSIAFALGAYAQFKKPQSRAWAESISLGVALSSAACLGLIWQTYQINGGLREFYFSWSILALPLLYVYRSTSIFILLSLVTIFWIPMIGHQFSYAEFGLFAALNGSCLFHLIQSRKTYRSQFLFFCYTFSSSIAFFAILGNNLSYGWQLWAALFFATVFLWDTYSKKESSNLRFIVTGSLSQIALIVLAVTLSFDDTWTEGLTPSPIQHRQDFLSLILALIVSASFLYLIFRRATERRRLDLAWASFPIIVLLGKAVAYNSDAGPVLAAMGANAYLIGLSILIAADAYKKHSVAKLNQGLAIFTILAIVRFFDSDLSMLARGIGFLVLGIGMIAFNFSILKTKKEVLHG